MTAPTTVVIAVVAGHVGAVEMEEAAAVVAERTVVNVECVAISVAPVLVEQVAEVDYVETQLNGVGFASYAEVVFLCQVDVEVMFEGQVVGKSFEIFSAMLAHVGVAGNPSFEQCTLLVFG